MKSKWIRLFLLSPVAILLLLLSARLSTVGGATLAIQAGYLPTPRPYEVCDVCEPNGALSQACGPLDPDHSYQFPIRCAAQPSDDDWYYIDLETPATVTLTLTDIPAGTDYDIYLYDKNRQILCSSNNPGPEPEYVVCDLSQGGRYYVRVYPYESCDDDNLYTLVVDYPPPAPTPIPTAPPPPPCNVHIDDFEDSNPDNDLGKPSGWELIPPGCGDFDVEYTNSDLRLDYNLTSGPCTARYFTILLLDASPNEMLTFETKGNAAEELRHTVIGLRDEEGHEARIKIGDFLSRVLTDTWQAVNLPLAAFTPVDASQLDTFFIELTNAQEIPGTIHLNPGTMYLDNLRLERPHAPLIVDNFNDQAPPNALGGAHGIAYSGTAVTLKTTYASEDTFDDSPASYVISYSVPTDTWALWETNLQGLNVSDYAFLAFAIKGAAGGEKVNLYLQDRDDELDYVNVETYTSIFTGWIPIRVPLQAFAGVDLTSLNKIKFTFEWDPMTGTIFLDDLRFVADTLLVDNFCDDDERNSLNGAVGTFISAPPHTATVTSTLSYGALRLDYDVSDGPGCYSGYFSRTPLDLNPYRSLSVKVRGERCGQAAIIHVNTDLVEPDKLKLSDFLLDGITDQWQEAKIPLAAYTTVIDWTRGESYAIAFDADRGASKGATWWDDIAFETACAPLWVDNFNDEDNVDALRDIHHIFKNEDAEMVATYSVTHAYGDAGAGLALTYVVPPENYAGWEARLRNVDLSNYDRLVFKIKGAAGGASPYIYLQDGQGQRRRVKVENYVNLTTMWKTVVIPLEDFGELDRTRVGAFQVVIEHETTDVEGTLILDNIRFTCMNRVFLPMMVKSHAPSALDSLEVKNYAPAALALNPVWDFESDTEGWTTYKELETSRAVIDVMTSTFRSRWGNASLALPMTLDGDDARIDRGIAYVNLTETMDLACKPLSCWIYVPTCGLGDPDEPTYARLFVKDENGNYEYGTLRPVLRNQWYKIELRPSIITPYEGYKDSDFDPRTIIRLGVQVRTDSHKTVYHGKVFVDACGWEEINGSTHTSAAETCWPDRDTE